MALVENKNLPIFFKEKEITKEQLDQLKDVLRDAINQLSDVSSANTVSITTLNNIVLPAINIVTQSLGEFDQAKEDIATILAQAAAIQVALTQISTEVAYQAQVVALSGQLLLLTQALNAAEGVLTNTTILAGQNAATLAAITQTGTTRVKKAEATQDADPETLTAASVIRQTADRVDQDLTSTNANGPTFQKVTVIDKELTKNDLEEYDTAYTHSQIADGTNPHQTTADNIGYDTPGFSGFLENDTDVQSSLQTLDTHDHDTDYVKLSQLGADTDVENGIIGVATLTELGVVHADQLPSYVDDIVRFETYADLPGTGNDSIIYIVYDDPDPLLNTSYRWDGTNYFPFDEKHAQWGFISGDILEQVDIEDAVYTPRVDGLITDDTIGEAIQSLDNELNKVIIGTTKIAFSDASLSALDLEAAISEVKDEVDDIVDGTTDITFVPDEVNTNISATEVEAAINQLGAEVKTYRASNDTAISNIVNGTTDLTFVPNTTNTNLTELKIEEAINELGAEVKQYRIDNDDRVTEIEDGTTDITFDPTGTTLDSLTVEAAIKEIYLEKAANNGIATLDANGRIPSEQLPLDAMEFKGTFGSAQSTTLGDLPASANKGDIYLCDTDDYTSVNAGNIIFQSGDKAIWDGVAWVRNAARDSVVSVNEKSGAVTLVANDIDASTANFNGKLTSVGETITIQQALDLLDDHEHSFSEITSTPTTLSGYGISDAYTDTQTNTLLAGKVDVSALSSSLTLYVTNTTESGGTFDGYFQLVDNLSDARYNDTEVIVYTTNNLLVSGTSTITSEDPETPSVVAGFIADAGLFVGDIGIINATTIGELKYESGNRYPRFRFKIYKSDDMVNHIAVSEYTDIIDNTTFQEFFENALVNNGVFSLSDRIVITYEAYKTESGGNDPIVAIKIGGDQPTRTNLPIPVNVTQNAALISFDNSPTSLQSTNVQNALDELSGLLDSNTTQIRVEQFTIINADNGDGTFTYRNADNVDATRSNASSWFNFLLEQDGFYAGGNLVYVNINNDTTYYLTDTTNLEEGTPDVNNIVTQVLVSHGFVNGDKIDIYYYQGVNIASSVINNGSVTFAKLDNTLQARSTLVSGATAANTANQLVLRDALGDFSANEITATLVGKFKTARSITLDGDVSGTANFDGSANITITTVVADNSHSHQTSDITGLQDVIDSISAVTISGTEPAEPNETDLWFNSTDGILYIYYNDGDSSQWVGLTYGETIDAQDIAYVNATSGLTATNVQAAIDEVVSGGLGASVTISETAPTGAEVGDLWYDSTVSALFIYYNDGSSSQWVEVTYQQDYAEVDFYTTTIAAADTWTDQTGYFTLAKTVSGLTATDKPVVDLDLSTATVSNVADIQTAWGTIYRVVTGTDTVTFYALEDPTFPEDTAISIKVVK